MWFSDDLDADSFILQKYEERVCDILEIPKEFTSNIKKSLQSKNLNLERFLEMWEFYNDVDDEVYNHLYTTLYNDLRENKKLDSTFLIFWKLFDHILENKIIKIDSNKTNTFIYYRLNGSKKNKKSKNKDKFSILDSCFTVYKYKVDMFLVKYFSDLDYSKLNSVEKYLINDLNQTYISRPNCEAVPFIFKKTFFRYLIKKLKNYSKIIGKLLVYYYRVLDKRYKPGGVGYIEAEKSWYSEFMVPICN